MSDTNKLLKSALMIWLDEEDKRMGHLLALFGYEGQLETEMKLFPLLLSNEENRQRFFELVLTAFPKTDAVEQLATMEQKLTVLCAIEWFSTLTARGRHACLTKFLQGQGELAFLLGAQGPLRDAFFIILEPATA